jgi:hypothetical protein
MRDRKAGASVKKWGAARTVCPPRSRPPAAADPPIPVCLGEFGFDEARDFCPLWEATWSQDSRAKAEKK